MILEDSISQTLSVLALMIIVYLATFIGLSDLLFIPLALLLGGIAMQFYMRGKPKHDENINVEELKSMSFFVMIALAGIGLGSLSIPHLFQPPSLPFTLTIYDAAMYGVLYAIAEERFFRGFITPFLMWKLPFALPVNFLSGGIFSIYHFSVYGSSVDKLLYVFIAGTILSYVTLQSRRLTPCSVAHIINNLLAI